MMKAFSHISEALNRVVNRANLNKVMAEKTLNDLLKQYFDGLGVAIGAKCVIRNNIIWAECASLTERAFVSEHLETLAELAREHGLTLPWRAK